MPCLPLGIGLRRRHGNRDIAPQAGLEAGLLDEAVGIALQGLDAQGPGAFPLVDGVHPVPGLHEPALGAAEVQGRIALRHVEGAAGKGALGRVRRLRAPSPDVHLHGAATESPVPARQLVVAEVAAQGVHGAHRGIKVVHVRLHAAELGVGLRATPSPEGPALGVDALGRALAPFDEGPAEVLRRHGVLPLHAQGPVCMLRRLEAPAHGNALAPVEGVAAVDGDAVVGIDLALKPALGLGQAPVGLVAGRRT